MYKLWQEPYSDSRFSPESREPVRRRDTRRHPVSQMGHSQAGARCHRRVAQFIRRLVSKSARALSGTLSISARRLEQATSRHFSLSDGRTERRWLKPFVDQLATGETAGDVVRLSLGTYRGSMGCQVTRRRDQHVNTSRGSTRPRVLSEGCLDGLYRMEVPVFAQQQSAQSRKQRSGITTIQIIRHRVSRLVYPLLAVEKRR